MPLRITETGSLKNSTVYAANTDAPCDSQCILKVEGCLYLEDAELLEKICRDLRSEGARNLILDLADLSFLDSESASVLCRLRREQDVSLEGLHLFVAKVVELCDAEATVSEYLPKVPTEARS